jgi:protease-4
MRDSIFYSAIKALLVAFCAVIGLVLGLFFIIAAISSLSSGSTTDSRLTSVNTEEILPNADGKRTALSKDAPVILQLNIEGMIGVDSLTTNEVRQRLVESREGDFKGNRVKGILLYMNTPGGYSTDSDNIFRMLLEYRKQYNVPIYAYVDGLCASGGMYIALAADKIIASETSLIGSVGVIAPTFMNFTKVLEKIGVDTLTLSAGKDKDAMNPLRPWKPGEEDNYKNIIDYLYNEFVDLVVTHRPISKEQLVNDFGARIFPAPIAKEHGYVDESGVSLRDALKELVQAAGIKDENYQVIKLEDKGWWKSLFKSEAVGLLRGEVKHRLYISPEMDMMMQNRFMYLHCPHLAN